MLGSKYLQHVFSVDVVHHHVNRRWTYSRRGVDGGSCESIAQAIWRRPHRPLTTGAMSTRQQHNTTLYLKDKVCVCKHYFPQRLPKLYSIRLQKSLHYFCVYKNLKCYNFHFSIWLKSVRNKYFHNYLYISFKKSIYYYYFSRCSREITPLLKASDRLNENCNLPRMESSKFNMKWIKRKVVLF